MSNHPPSTKAAETVMVNGTKYGPIREGLATILAPYRDATLEPANSNDRKPRNNDEGEQPVFYNPIQQFNRDLSVLAILVYGEAALVEKAEKCCSKAEHLAKQKERIKKRHGAAGLDSHTRTDAEFKVRGTSATNKRKRTDEGSVNTPAESELVNGEPIVKRTKTDDLEPDDEELEIMQAYGSDPMRSHYKDTARSEDPSTTLASKSRKPRFAILDALSATGLRALRYAKEIPFVTNVIANDLSRNAAKSIEANIDYNDVKEKVYSNVADARAYMYSKVGNEHSDSASRNIHRFDVIDLDPYGTAALFFDAAVQAIRDGGLLCVTCTDAGVFASNGYPEKAYALYGGIPMKGAHSHEGGLRLILHAIASSAAKYGMAIEPLLSLSIDFYARVFVRIHKQQRDVKLLAGTTMIVYSCDYGCGAWKTQPLARNNVKESKSGEMYFKHSYAQAPDATPCCEHCNTKTHLSGPFWAGLLHNPYFIQRILEKLPSLDEKVYGTIPRIEGMLTVALEEDLTLDKKIVPSVSSDFYFTTPQSEANSILPIPRLPPAAIDPHPFFFIPNYLCKVLHCETPSEDALRGALRHLGYRVTRSHCKAGSFRTDAPWSVVWEVMREWVRTQKPIKDGAVREGTAGWRLLGRLRGSERGRTTEIKEELRERIMATENTADVGTVLEAALYRLGREQAPSGRGGGVERPTNGDANAETEKVPTPIDSSKLKVVFDEALGRDKPAKKMCRYQLNPKPNWGPMNRATGN